MPKMRNSSPLAEHPRVPERGRENEWRDDTSVSWKGLLVAVCVSQKGSMPRQSLKHSLQKSSAWNRLSESFEGTRVETGNKIQPFP